VNPGRDGVEVPERIILDPRAPGPPRCVVFLPGFMATPAMYRSLLAPLADGGVRVVIPMVTRPGPALLLGRVRPDDEAARVVSIVRREREAGRRVWLGGHSRGGLVAWLAAADADPERLLLVDPVAGGGPPWASPEPLPARSFRRGPLVVGLGEGGRCAPAGRNHEVFAATAPGCDHVVVPGAGHADVLDPRPARLGRALCGGSGDGARARALVGGHLVAAVG
jgi:pimeloyl-ACP methyl ester carboxylesterase